MGFAMPKPFRRQNWGMPRCVLPVLFAVITVGTDWSLGSDTPADQVEFFEKQVRPVLVESCGKCHGVDKQSGGLRLDSRAALLEGGENGPAVVVGQPDQSLLIQVVRQTHNDIKMPPKGKLTDAQAETLEDWVKLGAPWGDAASGAVAQSNAPAHWAFQPVQSVAPPAVSDRSWPRSPVDAFILSRLEKEGVQPAPEADKRTLVRRVAIDLTGLPPTLEQRDEFLSDDRPDAYERMVERFLDSPLHGERWGRFWLDIARYADTKGYVFTEDRNYPYSYTYRDYVIRSLNEDKPYDQFVVEQLAADRLGPNSDPAAQAALGFLTLGRRFLNNQDDIIDDRIDVVCRGLLGLTVSCARCHDHKYDPIPTEDYYALHGVFASSFEPPNLPEIPANVPEGQVREFQAQLAAKQQAIDDSNAAKLAEIQADLRNRVAAYLQAAHTLGFDGKNPRLEEQARAGNLSQSRLRSVSGRFKARLEESKAANDPVFCVWHAFAALPLADFADRARGVVQGFTLDHLNALNPIVARAFIDTPPATMDEVVERYASILGQAAAGWAQAQPAEVQSLPGPDWEQIRQVILGSNGVLVVSEADLPRLLDRPERDALTGLKNALAQLKATHPGAPPRAMVLNDVEKPVQPHVYLRGNPGRPGKDVPRQFLGVLAGPERKPFQNGSGRLELGQAIASKQNPLTARVLVNRVWLNHFGTGLVNTPSDFGLRSEPPTYPELIDWLAADFMNAGWSIKALHRRILLSSTYRQSSNARPELASRDPENRLHARSNRRRLDFEAVRDAILFTTGSLDQSMGGRGSRIADLKSPARRTIYGFIDRQNLDPVYRTFDFASPDSSSPKRLATTVPQQALFLMNSPFILQQARRLAAASVANPADPAAGVRVLYERLLGREPDSEELALAVNFVTDESKAEQASVGNAGLSPWEELAQVLLLTNEFMFVD